MLTGEECSLLIMATVEELPYETIAQMLEVEIGTVKSQVSRVRAKLRRIQEETGGIALARVGISSKLVRTHLSAGTA
jgi:DNA-directed RNA polymerase specialized sigma24 family protein